MASLVLEKLMHLERRPQRAKLQHAIAPKLPEWIKRPSGVTPILQKLKQVRRTDLVLGLLEELQADGRMKLGPTHYSIGMSACNAAKRWSLSLHLFNSISKTMLSPDVLSSWRQHCYQRLRKGRSMAVSLATVQRHADVRAQTRRIYLQCHPELLCKSRAVATGLAAIRQNATDWAEAGCCELQFEHKRL